MFRVTVEEILAHEVEPKPGVNLPSAVKKVAEFEIERFNLNDFVEALRPKRRRRADPTKKKGP